LQDPHLTRAAKKIVAQQLQLKHLRERDMETPLKALAMKKRVPILAICVGMQMLAETCFEFGKHKGLGWIKKGITDRIAPTASDLILPHIGWNDISTMADHGGLLEGLDGQDFYFVHTNAMKCNDEYQIATAEYGQSITCAVRSENIFGVQFHPEKSSHAGSRLLSNFLAL